jgi:acetylornithine deacetylase/succinyl-diaminopimelate desuccinylase-like protein
MDFREFDRYVDDHAVLMLDDLSALCRIPSVSAENGPAMAEARQMVLDLSRQAGIATEVAPQPDGPAIVVGRAGSGSRQLMIYNHYDVQPPDPLDEWTSPPFEPTLRDGKLFARGASDNKGDLAARLWAIRAYQETIGALPVRVLYIIEGEEEVGSLHLASFAAEREEMLRGVDGCLWEFGYKDSDGRPVVNLGVKGILSVELRVRTADTDAHSGNGGVFPNAAWRLVEALNTLRASDGQVLIDGLTERVRPPSAREQALLDTLPWDGETMQRTYGLKNGFLGGLTGRAALHRLLFEPTVTINGMLSGYTGPGSKTVIPAQAMAKLDIRLVPDLTPRLGYQLLCDHLRRRGFADVDVVDLQDGLIPARTAPDALIARAVASALEDAGGVAPVVYPTSAGSGPMFELCQAYGIDVASAGAGWYGSRAHAPDESIRVADFVESVKFVGRLLQRFAEA